MKPTLNQSGFSLLIFLILLMGAGGIALAGFTKKISSEVKIKRFQDNQQVLKQAKQALLMYAYRYPQFNADGPGRLPCPDDDNDGLIGAIDALQCQSVGRLPWNDPNLDFYDARDASNERLWYAVSDNFYNFNPGGFSVVNSDTVGTITIVDQTGRVLYDGAVTGVAAVIIAPGPEINGQNRALDINDPTNYLDSFNGFDNSIFNNGESDTNEDGFILGPVFNPAQNSYVVNDQMVVITTEEIVAIAEKAVLETYRDSVRTYLANTVTNYPWLFDYNTLDLDAFNSGVTNIGRIPSIFSNYFSAANSEPIDTEIRLTVVKQFLVDNEVPSQPHIVFLNSVLTPGTVSNVRFEVDPDLTTHLRGDAFALTADDSFYFWKNGGDWIQCDPGLVAGGGRLLTDCNQDGAGNPTPGSATNDSDTVVLRVGIRLDYTPGIDFSLDYSAPAPVLAYAQAAGISHAEIVATFAANKVASLPVDVFYEEGDYDTASVFTVNASAQQEMTNDTAFGDVNAQVSSNVVIGMRYYPELPSWAKTSENNWHNSIQMAYAPDYQPNVGGADCTISGCLTVNDTVFTNNDIGSLLVIAGEHGLIDDEDPDGAGPLPGDGFTDDLAQIFDAEQLDPDLVFSSKSDNDKIVLVGTQ